MERRKTCPRSGKFPLYSRACLPTDAAREQDTKVTKIFIIGKTGLQLSNYFSNFEGPLFLGLVPSTDFAWIYNAHYSAIF